MYGVIVNGVLVTANTRRELAEKLAELRGA